LRRVTPLLTTLAVAAALVPPAWGASRPSTSYAAGVHRAGGQISTSLGSLVRVVRISLHYPTAPGEALQCASILNRTVARLEAAQTELRSLHPPRAARPGHARLVAGTAALARELRPLIAKLRNGYLVATAKVLSLPAVATIESAAKKLKAAGYPTGI
jgi:hypothetical protein